MPGSSGEAKRPVGRPKGSRNGPNAGNVGRPPKGGGPPKKRRKPEPETMAREWDSLILTSLHSFPPCSTAVIVV